MRSPLPKQYRYWIAVAAVVPMLTILFLASGIFQWSPLNCWHEDVDINSGRVRHTRFLLYCQIGNRIEDTWLSRTVNNPSKPPDWHRVNTFSPSVHYSPHYRYHGAIHQIKTLERIEGIVPFEPDARRKVADSLLAFWQNGDSYLDADDYIQRVAETAYVLHDYGALNLKASDVPND